MVSYTTKPCPVLFRHPAQSYIDQRDVVGVSLHGYVSRRNLQLSVRMRLEVEGHKAGVLKGTVSKVQVVSCENAFPVIR